MEAEGAVRGFLLSLTRSVPYFDDRLQPEQSWTSGFGVEPAWHGRGLGGLLLDAACDRLRGLGCWAVLLGPYIPNYFAPGIDVAAYAPGVAFLLRHGFQELEQALDMQASLIGFRTPVPMARVAARLLNEGVSIRSVTATDIVPVMGFVREHFSPNWQQGVSAVLAALFAGDSRRVGLLVALHGDTPVGFAQHAGEDFGPLGVREDARGRGIAKVLLAATLTSMRQQGHHAACIHWIYNAAARLYEQCGFREVRRFVMLRKAL